jgi:sRNA-binding regulator protein Hfq
MSDQQAAAAPATAPKRTPAEISTHVQSHFLKTARDAKTRLSFQGAEIMLIGRVVRWDSFTIVVQPEGERAEMLIFKQALAYIEPVPETF